MKNKYLFLLIPLLMTSLSGCACSDNQDTGSSEPHEEGVYYKISDLADIHQSVKAKITARVIASGRGRAIIYDGTGSMNVQLPYQEALSVGEKYVFEGNTVLTSHHEFTFKDGSTTTKTAYTGDVPEFSATPEEITRIDNYNGEVGKYVTIKGLISYKNGYYNESDMLQDDETYTLGYSDALNEYVTILANTDRYHKIGVDITGILYNKNTPTVGQSSGRIDILPTEEVKYTSVPITSIEVNDELKDYYNVDNIFNKDNALEVKVTYQNESTIVIPNAECEIEVKDATENVIDKTKAFETAGNYKVYVTHKGQTKDYTITVNNDGLHAVIKDPYTIGQENEWTSYAKTGNLNEIISLQAYGNSNSSGRYSETNNTWSISAAGTSTEPVGKLKIFVNNENSDKYIISKIKISYYGEEDKEGAFAYGNEQTEYLSDTELEVNDTEIELVVINKSGIEAINAVCRITRIMVVYQINTSSIISATMTASELSTLNGWEEDGADTKVGDFNNHISLQVYGRYSAYSKSNKWWSVSQQKYSSEPEGGQLMINLKDDVKDQYEFVSVKVTFTYSNDDKKQNRQGEFMYGDDETGTRLASATKLELEPGVKSIVLRVVPTEENAGIENAYVRITEISIQYQPVE